MMARPSLLTIMRLLLFFSFLAIVSTFVDAIPTGEQKYYAFVTGAYRVTDALLIRPCFTRTRTRDLNHIGTCRGSVQQAEN